MSGVETSPATVTARLDREGRLIDAEPRLLELIVQAGGERGHPLPLPEIGTLARLAMRLGIAITRVVVIADGDEDVQLWVRAVLDGDGVEIAAGDWRLLGPWRRDEAHGADQPPAFGGEWSWETDAALRLTHISAGARLGGDAAAMLGEPLTRLFALAEADDGAFPILDAVAGRFRFVDQPARLRDTGAAVRLSAMPRVDDRGRFAGFAGTVHHDEDMEASLPADTAAAPFGEGFVGQLDRALRAPLERIVANAASLSAQLDGPLPQSYGGYADDIASAGRHLLGMVTDLVDLEAVERPGFAIAPEPIDLADVARRAAGLLAVRAGERQVRIDRPATDESLPASGDFRRALQILVNLIGNAVRYSPEGGMVWVRCENDGGKASVIVADQGRGIAPADQALVFEKFGRVDPGEAGGSGLGLYISRRLARAMDGDITLDSDAGQGARFILTLPAR